MFFPSKKAERLSHLLHAAAQVFARQGYHGTSTREIARVANIAENTLFRYFESKEKLFWDVIRSCLSGLRLRRELLDSMAEGAGPEIVLPQIVAQLVDTVILKPELVRLLAIAFLELDAKAESVCYESLSPIFSAINGYLEKTAGSGKMRKLDPAILTSAIATTVILHPGLSRLMNGAALPYSDIGGAIQVYTKFWLSVLIAPPLDRSQSSPESTEAGAT
jgi:AcrR family transcriptional regulator